MTTQPDFERFPPTDARPLGQGTCAVLVAVDTRRVERWASIAGAPGYQVSTRGAVRRGAFLVATWLSARGYEHVSLEVPTSAWPSARAVHRIVLETFVGPANGRQANHIDGDKTNNALVNLEWVTARQNTAHYRRARARACGQLELHLVG